MTDFLTVPGSITRTGLVLPSNLTYEQWQQVGENMRGARESIKFFLGDWINYGEASYGEKYAQAISATDYDYDYLRNISYVCKRVTLSRRSDKLTFGHHQVVAPLSEMDQEIWLQAAEDSELTVRELREAIKMSEEKKKAEGDDSVAERVSFYRCNVVIESSYTDIISGEDADKVKKEALKKALKALTDDDVSINMTVVKDV
jgi:hypothetical protein